MIALIIWTVVATNNSYALRDWRPLAQFETVALCEEAVRSMNLQDRYRCLKTK